MENHSFYDCTLCTLTNILGKKKRIYLIICPVCRCSTLIDSENYSNILNVAPFQLVKDQPIRLVLPFKNIRLVLGFIENFYKVEIEHKKLIRMEIVIEEFEELDKESFVVKKHFELCNCTPRKTNDEKTPKLKKVQV